MAHYALSILVLSLFLVCNMVETVWKREWFHSPVYSHGHWRKRENQRLFLERIARELGITNPKEWGKIKLWQIRRMIGGSSMLNYHKGSLFKALQASFPGILFISLINPETSWKRDWFTNLPIFPKDHWNSRENQLKFLEKIASQYNIKFNSPADWKRITLSLIRKQGGQV